MCMFDLYKCELVNNAILIIFLDFFLSLILDGFRKQLTAQHGSLGAVVHGEDLEFAHPNFIRGHYDLLSRIQRKVSFQF